MRAYKRTCGRSGRVGVIWSMLFTATLSASGPAATCRPEFIPGETFNAGQHAGVCVLADINGDGALDITTGAAVLLGNGAGSFAEPALLPTLRGMAFDVVPADFDTDGLMDLAVTYFVSEDEAFGLLYGAEPDEPGIPKFEAIIAVPTVSVAWHLTGADFNEDSSLDLVTVGFLPSAFSVGVHIYEGNRTFGFERVGPISGEAGQFITSGDFDGDGHPDIAVGIGHMMGVLLGRGDGTFHDAVNWEMTVRGVPVMCHRCRAADLDRDGRSDLVVIGEAFVFVYHGSSIGRDRAPPDKPSILFDLSGTGRYLEIADMNGDGALDLVAQGVGGSTIIQIFWGTPGTEEGTVFEAGTPIYSEIHRTGSVIAVGDVTNDGALDIVITVEGRGDGQVFLNDGVCQPGAAQPGDANADGSVNLADPVAILSHLFRNVHLLCPGAAEVNDDGTLNLADPIYILQHLFANGPPLPVSGPRPCRSS